MEIQQQNNDVQIYNLAAVTCENNKCLQALLCVVEMYGCYHLPAVPARQCCWSVDSIMYEENHYEMAGRLCSASCMLASLDKVKYYFWPVISDNNNNMWYFLRYLWYCLYNHSSLNMTLHAPAYYSILLLFEIFIVDILLSCLLISFCIRVSFWMSVVCSCVSSFCTHCVTPIDRTYCTLR